MIGMNFLRSDNNFTQELCPRFRVLESAISPARFAISIDAHSFQQHIHDSIMPHAGSVSSNLVAYHAPHRGDTTDIAVRYYISQLCFKALRLPQPESPQFVSVAKSTKLRAPCMINTDKRVSRYHASNNPHDLSPRVRYSTTRSSYFYSTLTLPGAKNKIEKLFLSMRG
ncbi:hypothetical protein B9Z19DRAFT_647372 [Tuber borchii]|uniref:Uncharacterized protein n=1 Tax=Tuber borchii TaxID=42251 RepID=A0A2T6ZAT8_TUBBO|nr:hypothetical protein B9Z19DRAFT_647372 [Tuber borchii]